MEVEEPDASATSVLSVPKKKILKSKCHDLKYLNKKLPVYINYLKSNESNDLRRGLIGIKTVLYDESIEIENIYQALQSCAGIRLLVKIITCYNDQRQLGMLLCILHLAWKRINIPAFRTEMWNCGLMVNLADLLAKCSDVNNQLRILKFVSSISQNQVSGKESQSFEIVKSIVSLLSQSQHPSNVHTTAIKTLRRMWSLEKNHGKLLECGAVKAVATFLDTKDNAIFTCVLKTIVIFTSPCTISASQQVVGKGDGYHVIVARVGKPIVSELICNLSRSPVGRIELTRAGLVPEIIRQINSKKYDKYLIMALCQMCQESMVRASLRATPNGFETFLSIITNRAADQYHSDLLYALTYFVYDTQSLTMMVQAGLVDVLIEKLSDFADSMGNLHEETPEPEPIPVPTYSPTSPIYFPLSDCSYPSPGNMFSLTELCYINKKRRKENETSCSKSQDSCILEVLLQLTYHHTKLKTLALRDTIDTILRYMTTVDFSRQESNFLKATKILRAIVSCKHHFNKLLDDETIMSIHRELCVRRHWNCTYCDKLHHSGEVILTEMAESSESALGEGEMAHRLTSGTSLMKTTVALTIPFIIKQHKLLNSLLFMHRGLECLITALDSHIEDAVPALYSLMKTVGISNPQEESYSYFNGSSIEESEVNEDNEDVKFELDDGSAVAACKERLAQNYPMFEAMFRGGFREAGAETVRLPDVSAACLKALVSLNSAHPSPTVLPSSVSILLEMVSVSDRFLSPILAKNLISHITHKVLTFETTPEIYSWSVNIGCKFPYSASMAITTLSYLFTASMFSKDRVQAVQTIIDSPEKQNLFCDLNSIILSGMQEYHNKVKHARLFWDSPRLLFPSLF